MKLSDTQIVDCAHTNNRVIDSRDNMYGIRRRRECTDCAHRWTTLEVAVEDTTSGRGLMRSYRRQVKRGLYRLMSKQFGELADGLDRKGLKHLESK